MKQKLFYNFLAFYFIVLFFTLAIFPVASAEDLSSSSFTIKDPLIGTGGGYFSSASFGLFGSGDGVLTGYNTSAGFIGQYGFLYFPAGSVVVPPAPSTPPPAGGGGGGDARVSPLPASPIAGICGQIADFNCDGFVNILDLSILLYYTDRSGSILIPYDLSPDGLIDLRDISILFYYWDF